MGNITPAKMSIGYRITSIDERSGISFSPAIVPMLDFIVYPDTDSIKNSQGILHIENVIAANPNKELELTVYNIISQDFRKVRVVTIERDGKGYLGIKIRPEDYTMAHIKVMHILSCMANGPLANAGVSAKDDYILGTRDEIFADLDEFKEFLRANDKKEIVFLAYNSEKKSIREVMITPDTQWGGEGCLGGDIGYGISHAIPKNIS